MTGSVAAPPALRRLLEGCVKCGSAILGRVPATSRVYHGPMEVFPVKRVRADSFFYLKQGSLSASFPSVGFRKR